MKRTKKIIKWVLIPPFIILLSLFLGTGIYVFFVYQNAKQIEINTEALSMPSVTISIYNSENKPINDYNEVTNSYSKISTLSENTKNAFISIEDKTFYSHHGVNYKRIVKAMLKNITSLKLKEGASTISQQLVKNTQLTSEKTFERKIKEIALAKKIEKKYSKDEILEMYLNVIYFGNNCYGIENASNYYFSKQAKELSLEEAAVLAGIIKSPTKYSPLKNYENCIKRRNIVLGEMLKDGKINEIKCEKSKKMPILLKISTKKKNRLNSYSQASLDEAEQILGLPARQIALCGYKIYTYQDDKKQSFLENAIESQEVECDYAGIVLDNKENAVVAYIGKGDYKILESPRQPGSIIKPIIVYGPALNEDIIYPCTQLLDERTTINDYNPKNVGDVYHGYVSARQALSKSYNIPAVKVLSYVGIEKAKAYGEEMGIKFEENDDSYTLALGGMTYGSNILSLAGAYSTFANDGYYAKPKFISFITDKNNKIIYINKNERKRILREDSAYMLTDMLKTCAKTGTAKKLASLDIDIASKTGTVGKQNSKENLDAWNISYTKEQTCGIWLGNLDNTSISYAGGNQPTEIVRKYFEQAGDNSTFAIPNSIIEKNIDMIELEENHRIILANKDMPERFTSQEIFSKFNLPSDYSKKFQSIETPSLKSKVENSNVIIEFDAKEYLTYKFYEKSQCKAEISGKNGEQKIIIPLSENNEKIRVTIYYTLKPEISYQNEISLINTASHRSFV